MDAPPPTNASYVPRGLPPQRGYRWCVLRTLRDVHRAAERGHAISLPNTLRLFSRRWHRTARLCQPVPKLCTVNRYRARGIAQLRAHLMRSPRPES